MLTHDFGIMEEPPAPGEKFSYEPEKYKCISIDDDALLSKIEALCQLDFFWNSVDRKEKGLAYHGITLIPPESMPQMVAVITADPKLLPLKNLLVEASEQNKFVIHYGI